MENKPFANEKSPYGPLFTELTNSLLSEGEIKEDEVSVLYSIYKDTATFYANNENIHATRAFFLKKATENNIFFDPVNGPKIVGFRKNFHQVLEEMKR